MRRDIQFAETIEVPFAEVLHVMGQAPGTLFGLQGNSIYTAQLHVHVGPAELLRDVTVEILGFDRPSDEQCALVMRWDATEHGQRFPHMEARLEALAIDESKTTMFLVGTYKPPFGLLGGILDGAGLHRFAEESVSEFFKSMCRRLR